MSSARLTVTLVIALVSGSLDTSALALNDARSSPSQNIQVSATELEQLQIALQSPDASTRYAAFVEAIESGRPEMREMAINVGISSSDEVMQQLAIRAGFIGTSVISPELVEAGSADLLDQIRYQSPVLVVERYDWKSGRINEGVPNPDAYCVGKCFGPVGQVKGSAIAYKSQSGCDVSFRRVKGTWEFRGIARCNAYQANFSYLMR